MTDFLKTITISAVTVVTCIIVGIGFRLFVNAVTTSRSATEKINNANDSMYGDAVDSYDGLTISGETALDLISKYQTTAEIGMKTSRFTKYFNKKNQLVKNSVRNLDYVSPEVNYRCKVITNKNKVLQKILLTEDGYYLDGRHIDDMAEDEPADVFTMFTESGSFVVPEGVTAIDVAACASGVGWRAGEYIGEDQDNPYTIAVSEGDVLDFDIVYEGDTTLRLNGTELFRLEGGSIDVSKQSSVLGFVTGLDGGHGSNGFINNQQVTSGAAVGGRGGCGGAFGYGGGGGSGAIIDTFDGVVTVSYGDYWNYSITQIKATGAGVNNAMLLLKDGGFRAQGGKGSVGADLFGGSLPFSPLGTSGEAGSLYQAGAGGTSSFKTEGYQWLGPDLAEGTNVLNNFSAAAGAGGGGGAGGYGAGGGEGGYGVEDDVVVYEYIDPVTKIATYYTNTNSLTEAQRRYCSRYNGITVDNAESGKPTGGMIYLYCH